MLERGFLGAGLAGTMVGLWVGPLVDGADAAQATPVPMAVVTATTNTEDPAAWSVEAVTQTGARYTGVILNSTANRGLFGDGVDANLSARPPSTRVELLWFNGLSGNIGLKVSDLRSLEQVGTLSEDELRDRQKSRAVSDDEKWVKERARLARVFEDRARRATKAAEEAASQADKAAEALNRKLTDDQREWLDRFHPEDGWIPARKTQLYHQSVILDNQPLTDQEREWLDHYDKWKPAYDLWLDAEKKRLAAEAAAEQAGKLAAAGDQSNPSGTAKSSAASIEPVQPTDDEAKRLPIPLSPDAPDPVKIGDDAPKPIPLSGAGG